MVRHNDDGGSRLVLPRDPDFVGIVKRLNTYRPPSSQEIDLSTEYSGSDVGDLEKSWERYSASGCSTEDSDEESAYLGSNAEWSDSADSSFRYRHLNRSSETSVGTATKFHTAEITASNPVAPIVSLFLRHEDHSRHWQRAAEQTVPLSKRDSGGATRSAADQNFDTDSTCSSDQSSLFASPSQEVSHHIQPTRPRLRRVRRQIPQQDRYSGADDFLANLSTVTSQEAGRSPFAVEVKDSMLATLCFDPRSNESLHSDEYPTLSRHADLSLHLEGDFGFGSPSGSDRGSSLSLEDVSDAGLAPSQESLPPNEIGSGISAAENDPPYENRDDSWYDELTPDLRTLVDLVRSMREDERWKGRNSSKKDEETSQKPKGPGMTNQDPKPKPEHSSPFCVDPESERETEPPFCAQIPTRTHEARPLSPIQEKMEEEDLDTTSTHRPTPLVQTSRDRIPIEEYSHAPRWAHGAHGYGQGSSLSKGSLPIHHVASTLSKEGFSNHQPTRTLPLGGRVMCTLAQDESIRGESTGGAAHNTKTRGRREWMRNQWNDVREGIKSLTRTITGSSEIDKPEDMEYEATDETPYKPSRSGSHFRGRDTRQEHANATSRRSRFWQRSRRGKD